MEYVICGNSGLLLPKLSLGLWHNFGSVDSFENAERMLLRAFELGITHFDLANNYGPEPGSAERVFGKVLAGKLKGHRDEIIASSKAGHRMWSGPYGDGSSRKSIMASIDQSLKRTGLDYFDIFYSHRYDGITPIEETMQALADIVRCGKALYVGISKYPLEYQRRCYSYLQAAGVPCVVSQYRNSMFDRSSDENLKVAQQNGSGVVVFSPLAQGLLTDKYLDGIPANSPVSCGKIYRFLTCGSSAIAADGGCKAIDSCCKETWPDPFANGFGMAAGKTTSHISNNRGKLCKSNRAECFNFRKFMF